MSFMHMRIARPVTHLDVSLQMYSEGLGLKKIAEFQDPDGYRVVISNKNWVMVEAG